MNSEVKNTKLPKMMTRGQLNSLMPAIITLVMLGIIGAVGALVLAGVRTQVESSGNNSYAFNATTYAFQGTNQLLSWTPTIALVIAAAIIIGLIFVAFRAGQGGPGG